jgi:hypothetical protein
MDAEAAKLIGAGLAAIGAGLAAGGVGNVFGSFLQGALRNPAAGSFVHRLRSCRTSRSACVRCCDDPDLRCLIDGFASAQCRGILS